MIAALPRDELAVQALFHKASLEADMGRYTDAIENYQALIRRFNKHELAIESYVQIANCYLRHTQDCYPELNNLELAKLNQRNFFNDFPSEPRVAVVEKLLHEMEEVFAGSLLELAELFAIRGREDSSLLYYRAIVSLYPATESAVVAAQFIDRLTPATLEEGIIVQNEGS